MLRLVLDSNNRGNVGNLVDAGEVRDHPGHPGPKAGRELLLGGVGLPQATVEQGRA